MAQGKAFKPSDEQRKIVRAMTAYGTPQEQIALVLDVTDKTLRKHFRAELDSGAPEANAQVAESLFNMAIGRAKVIKDGEVIDEGVEPKPAAAIFWMKSRAGWREVTEVEVSRKNNSVSDEPLTDEEWEQQWAEQHAGSLATPAGTSKSIN